MWRYLHSEWSSACDLDLRTSEKGCLSWKKNSFVFMEVGDQTRRPDLFSLAKGVWKEYAFHLQIYCRVFVYCDVSQPASMSGDKKPPAVSNEKSDQLLYRTLWWGCVHRGWIWRPRRTVLVLSTLMESQYFKRSFIAQQNGLMRKLIRQLNLAVL